MEEISINKVPQKVRDMFNKGFVAFEHGNIDYAIDLLSACVVAEPAFLQARKFLRSAQIQKVKQTKSGFLSQLTSMAGNMPAYLHTVTLVKTGKNPLEGLAAAEKLMQVDPLNMKFIKLFAQAAVNANFPEAAVQTLEVARDNYPEDITVLNWLGSLYQKVGRTKAARECFEKLCEVCPNDPTALKSLKDALALDSMSTDGWSQASESGGSFRDIIKDEKEAAVLEKESKEVKTDTDLDTLIADTKEKIKAEPENINYMRALSRLFVQKNDFVNAINTMNKAIAISPGDPELDNTMTNIKIEQYNHEIALLKKAGRQEAADEKELEKEQFIFDDLTQKVKAYPNDMRLRFDYGVMLYDNDYIKEAIQQFQLSQRSPKHRTKALYYLAMCFKQKQQYDMAIEQLEKASSELSLMDEDKKDICYELGLISELMGNKAKAAVYYKQIYQVDIGYKDIAERVEKVYSK